MVGWYSGELKRREGRWERREEVVGWYSGEFTGEERGKGRGGGRVV